MNIECPYCEEELEINHDDGFGYEEGIKHEMHCEYCKKTFVFETCVSFSYEAEKADCLNDGEHNWEKTKTYPIECTRMQCTMCGEKRGLTEAEWAYLRYTETLRAKY